MRQAQIYNQNQLAGILIENEEGYTFSIMPIIFNLMKQKLSALRYLSRKSPIQA